MTKHFDKTLQEICDILAELNEELHECISKDKDSDWFTGFTCEFNEWWACIKFETLLVLDSEVEERGYDEYKDEYEDLKDCVKRIFLERINRYSLYKFKTLDAD